MYQGKNIPNNHMATKYTKWAKNRPNNHMATKYTKWTKNRPNSHKRDQHLPLQDPPKFTKLGFLV
jgi:hypothetical protein